MRTLLLAGAAIAALSPSLALAQSPSTTTAKDTPATSRKADAASAPIVVTASPFDARIDETPAITAKVSAQSMLLTGGASIAGALQDVPGVAASGFAAGASRPIIRGMDSTRVRMLENGISSADVSDIGPDHGVPIDPLAARSIEVVRGAGTLRYGSQAIGGVVNVLNNRVPTFLPTETISGEVTGSYGTAADTAQTSALIDAKAGNFAIHADAFYRHADDYDTPDGTQANSWFHGHGESGGLSYFFGDSHIGAAVEQYNASYGIPSDDTHIVMKQTKYISRDVIDIDSGLLQTLTIDAGYADYQHSEVEDDGTIDTTFKNKEFDGHAELKLGAIGPLSNTAVGFEYGHRKFRAIGEDASYLYPTTTENEAGYIFTEMPITDSLKLQGSGRIEHVSVAGTPASDIPTTRDFTPVSGAIGALWTASSAIKIGLNFSSTGRAPAQTELFARGGHDGPNTFETGDPTLKIERANSLEASLRVDTGRLRFEGSLYSTWFNNYIYGELTGRTCDDDGVCTDDDSGELKELNYTQQNAHFRGAEGQASYAIVDDDTGEFDFKVMADYVRATLDDGSNVPRIPPYRVGGGFDWKSKPLDAGVMLKYVGRQDKFGDYDTATGAYYDLGAHIAWRPFAEHQGIEFAIVGQNLTNDVQRDAAAFNKAEVEMPGRNVRFVVKVATL
ncbi:TonB-dependent receptor [Novosphingobium sp. 1949]|uniref:TonB-dependent receptor n=1 Tax=Novosphingobium organovorum TaxID=2930092 RepID=A0ABT0BIT0_9SPHN|nr:TonB-dependent receptor [Novosphingobium organovorum]MCJ2184845.1 TonB-dependent receptor [Novosphingobium organovorum]